MIELLPILPNMEANAVFAANPDCNESLEMSVNFYKVIGFNPPWICYYASIDGTIVGCAAYKGKPVNNKIEIAYGTVPRFQKKGIGSAICRKLVDIALQTDPSIVVTARTLQNDNYSARLLRKNGFKLLGTVTDPEDGEVWEWEYVKQ